MLAAAFGADACGFVFGAGASPPMGSAIGVGDVVGVDAEQVEVAGGPAVVAVPGRGDVVDAAVGVVPLGQVPLFLMR